MAKPVSGEGNEIVSPNAVRVIYLLDDAEGVGVRHIVPYFGQASSLPANRFT
jgi:hypothetical protein